MRKPRRCHECKHRPGPRVLVHAKTKGGAPVEPRQHKAPCHCECHGAPEAEA